MSIISVAEAARELKMEEPEFLRKLNEMGIYAEDSFSTFKREDFERIKTILKTEGIGNPLEVVETQVRPGLIRRRAKKSTKPAPPPEIIIEESAAPEVEEEIAPEPGELYETALPEAIDESVAEIEGSVAEEVPEVEAKTAKEDQDVEPEPEVTPEEREEEQVTQPKKVKVTGVTKSPARVLEKPSDDFQLQLNARPIPAGKGKRVEDADDIAPPLETAKGRSRRGRTVVEVIQQDPHGPTSRKRGSKRKEIELREFRLDRRTRSLGTRKKKLSENRQTEITTPKAGKRVLKISEGISVGNLAKRMGIKASEIIRYLMLNMGAMVTLNQALDMDTSTIVAAEFGFDIESSVVDESDILNIEEDASETLVPRPPVVTIMGHVDHGKTSLLEAIREVDNMLSKEAGGITQHIGAYNVKSNKGQITFLDTPGHEAFTQMRARGAEVTDIVVLVVAADDGVMPQTKEAINHAKAANVPIIVAVNKIDKPGANIEKIKQEMTEFELVAEEWGGTTQYIEVSAKQRINIETLLDSIIVQAEMLELKANPTKRVAGVVIEAKLERGRGPVATVLIKEGTLHHHEIIAAGPYMGRVRIMSDHRGRQVDEAGPSMAVEVVGLSGVPLAGDPFNVLPDEKAARQLVELRQNTLKSKEAGQQAKTTLQDLHDMIELGETKDLNLIIKADVQGSIEAVRDALLKLSTDKVQVKVLHSSVGAISETDVNLALASKAIIVGFSVRPNPAASQAAEREGIEIKLYNVIYDAVNEIKDAMLGLLGPDYIENMLGRAEIRQTFHISHLGTIGGSYVLEGKIRRGAKARLVRDGVVVFQSKISTLRRFKEDAKEVPTGMECGITLENFNDLKISDIIEAFDIEEVAPEL